jgi:hypothetical protein
MQLLYAIKEFREAIRNSSSEHLLVKAYQEIFEALGSPRGILKGRMENLLKQVFTVLNDVKGATFFQIGRQDDAFLLIQYCFELLGGTDHFKAIDKETVKCFEFQWKLVVEEKSNPVHKEVRRYNGRIEPIEKLILSLPIGPNEKDPGGFMKALESLNNTREGKMQMDGSQEKVDVITHRQIENPPPVLLMRIMRLSSDSLSGNLIKINNPMDIPLQFEMPKDMMATSDPVNYELIGSIVHSGTAGGGHYIAYIKTEDGFLEFSDSSVRKLNDKQALEILKSGAYVLAYRCMNPIKKSVYW